MSENFRLTAIPFLISEGEDKGQLEGLSFIANAGTATHRWWAVNTGTLESAFSTIVMPVVARDIVNQIRNGETATFPDSYPFDRIYMKFGSSVHVSFQQL